MTMTPEERAKAVADRFFTDGYPNERGGSARYTGLCKQTYEGLQADIASAIKAAETDAREKALEEQRGRIKELEADLRNADELISLDAGEAAAARIKELETPWRCVDAQDWDYLFSLIGDGGRDRFWKAVLTEHRAALAMRPSGQADPVLADLRSGEDATEGNIKST